MHMRKRETESTNTQNIKFRYINGDVYEGEWKDGKWHGQVHIPMLMAILLWKAVMKMMYV